MERFFLGVGAISGLVGVAAGAFGAHGLRGRLEPRMLEVFETAVRYQMYHALALLAVGWACTRLRGNLPPAAGWLFVAGTVIFSGSLYILSLTGQRWFGAITPVGGAAFLAGWTLLAIAAIRE